MGISWVVAEMKVATVLGLATGSILGLISFQASYFDIGFAVAIFVANTLSVITAGLTGTLAPLIFTFLFHRDSDKWSGLIETAIQDVIGCFTMVVLSYKILVWMGPDATAVDS